MQGGRTITDTETLGPDFLRECFDYRDGELYWRERPVSHFGSGRDGRRWNTQFAGRRVTGQTGKHGYRQLQVRGKWFRHHRAVWAVVYGEWPPVGLEIDHINRVKTDNRIENLRAVTASENNRNKLAYNFPPHGPSRSGVHGVHWHSGAGKWRARFGSGRSRLELGLFATIEEAAAAIQRASVSEPETAMASTPIATDCGAGNRPAPPFRAPFIGDELTADIPAWSAVFKSFHADGDRL